MKRAISLTLAVCIGAGLVLFVAWISEVIHQDTRLEMLKQSAGTPIRGYNRSGRLVFTGILGNADSVPMITSCRAKVHSLGGGVCRVSPGSIHLASTALTRDPYSDSLIDIERGQRGQLNPARHPRP